MTNLTKAISSASLMNTIFCEYVAGDLNSSGELVRKKVAKFMRQRSKSNKQEFLDAIMMTDKVWKEAINHFADKKISIEAKSTIAAIYNFSPKNNEKFMGLKDKHIEKMMINITDNYEAEKNSDAVVKFIMERLGFESKKSLFSGKRLIIANNLILEGKDVDEKFLGVKKC